MKKTIIMMLVLIVAMGACIKKKTTTTVIEKNPIPVLKSNVISYPTNSDRAFLKQVFLEHGKEMKTGTYNTVSIPKGDTITITSAGKEYTGVLNGRVKGVMIANVLYLKNAKVLNAKKFDKGKAIIVTPFENLQAKTAIVSLNSIYPLDIRDKDWNYWYANPSHYANDCYNDSSYVYGPVFEMNYIGAIYLKGEEGKLWRTHTETEAARNK